MALSLEASFARSCRLCAEVQDASITIFSQEAQAMRLQNKLNKYLLIEIDEDDRLPKNICLKCCSTLQTVCDFIDCAHKAQDILQERSSLLEQLTQNQSMEIRAIDMNTTTVKSEPVSDDETKDTGMEISVDPMMVLQNSDEHADLAGTSTPEPNVQPFEDLAQQEEFTDVTHLHKVDSENVSIKLIRKGSDNNFEDKIKDPTWKPFPCFVCRRSFCTELALKNHSWIHVNEEKVMKQYRCSICHEEYDHKAELIDHLKQHRMSGMCQLCGRIFRSERNLAAHMSVHLTDGKSYTCKVCGRSYNTRSNLKTHSITHSSERPFECHICKKSFKRNQDLKFHINQHTGAKPYKCPFCDKSFASSGNCYSHRSRMHPGRIIDGKIRRIQATKEGIAPTTPAPVPVKGVMKYQCQLCEHSFVKRDNFTYHMFQHTGVKPFHCKCCPERFVTRKGLLLHHDKKHGSLRSLGLLSKNMLLK